MVTILHVCMDCYEFYDEKFIASLPDLTYICPKTICSGEIVEIDELICPTILLLNQKGYATKYCCAGHWYDNIVSPYIYFWEGIEVPKELPYGFQYESPNIIRKRYEDFSDEYEDKEDKYDFVIQTNKDLYEWAKSLPNISEEW